MSLIIPEEMTLLQALEHFFPESSKRTLRQWLEFDRVALNGRVIKNPKHILSKGEELQVGPKKERTLVVNGMTILRHDRHFIVIDKPHNLLSVAAEKGDMHALQILRAYFQTPAIYAVHRIDKATSGILLFARGKASEEAFDKMFEAHSLKREYLAIVEGNLAQDKGTWKNYLKEQENYDVVLSSEKEGGSLAITHYEVIRRSKKFTYLKLQLETGRKHQIRVHCMLAGHPIIGDKRYGSTVNPIGRLGLHAAHLSFIHPFSGEHVRFDSDIPHSFAKLGLINSSSKKCGPPHCV